MTKSLFEFEIGEQIYDMHNGMLGLMQRFDIVSHIQWNEPGRDDLRHPPDFWRYLDNIVTRRNRQQLYTNKMLVVVDRRRDYAVDRYVLACAYAYDGRNNGFITLAEKTNG